MSENNGAAPASAAKLMVMSSQSKIAAWLRDVNPMLDQCITNAARGQTSAKMIWCIYLIYIALDLIVLHYFYTH